MSDTTGDAAYAAFVEVAWERHLAVAILLTGDRHRGEELLRLPVGKDGLERRLRRLYDAEPASDWGGAKPEFAGYVWSTAQDLLAGPLTPATRSALYRVLAEQPGISSPGKVTDALGRTGVALARKGTGEGEGEFRLVVDDGLDCHKEAKSYDISPPGGTAVHATVQVRRWW